MQIFNLLIGRSVEKAENMRVDSVGGQWNFSMKLILFVNEDEDADGNRGRGVLLPTSVDLKVSIPNSIEEYWLQVLNFWTRQ